MQMCLYAPNMISIRHFVPRVGTMSYLEFSLSKRGGGLISFSRHIPLLVLFFSGKLLLWSGLIIILQYISLQNIKSNMLMQLQNTFFMILQQLWRTVQDDTFERSYTKVPFLFIAHTAGSLLINPYVYEYMILVNLKYWAWQYTVLIKITFFFRCIFDFNF